MKTAKRINTIVSLTLDDFYSNGFSMDKPRESLEKRLSDELLQIELIEDYNTYQVSILTLDKLQSLDIVDVSFITDIISNDAVVSYERA